MLKSLANLGVNDFFLQDIPTRHLRLNIDKSYFFLKRIVLDKNIDTVFCPAYEGGHQDHDVTNFIVSKLKAYCKTFEFPEYNFHGQVINTNTFFEINGSEVILELDKESITSQNINKILTIDETGKEKVFFYLLKKNKEIISVYREKITTNSDVNELFYFCRYFCQLIIESKNQEDYNKNIPIYLFREKNYLIEIFRKYNSRKKKLLLKLIGSFSRTSAPKQRIFPFFNPSIIVFSLTIPFNSLTLISAHATQGFKLLKYKTK